MIRFRNVPNFFASNYLRIAINAFEMLKPGIIKYKRFYMKFFKIINLFAYSKGFQETNLRLASELLDHFLLITDIELFSLEHFN